MRAPVLFLLLLAATPAAGGIGFAEIDGGPTATCGEGCIELAPGEEVVRLTPRDGTLVLWRAESKLGVPLAAGVADGATMIELPAGAARLVLVAL